LTKDKIKKAGTMTVTDAYVNNYNLETPIASQLIMGITNILYYPSENTYSTISIMSIRALYASSEPTDLRL